MSGMVGYHDMTDAEIDALLEYFPSDADYFENPNHRHTFMPVLETDEFTIYRCSCGKKEFNKKERHHHD